MLLAPRPHDIPISCFLSAAINCFSASNSSRQESFLGWQVRINQIKSRHVPFLDKKKSPDPKLPSLP
jgi:hypothetical protein